jgi:hypothetical protein
MPKVFFMVPNDDDGRSLTKEAVDVEHMPRRGDRVCFNGRAFGDRPEKHGGTTIFTVGDVTYQINVEDDGAGSEGEAPSVWLHEEHQPWLPWCTCNHSGPNVESPEKCDNCGDKIRIWT